MDPTILEGLLKAIHDAVSGSRRRDDDVALPVFDPSTSDSGAESWCKNIDTLAKELGWSSITTVAKAGKALKGSALLWFDTWDPSGGRSWENFRSAITDLYPEKKNLSEKLSKAVLFTSDSADTYCEYAREKIRLLRNTKVTFTESQLIELVCGSITDVNVRMASFNSSVKTTSELISLFSSYIKIKKRPLEHISKDNFLGSKRIKLNPHPSSNNASEKYCFLCGKSGHFKSQCFRRDNRVQTSSNTNNRTVEQEFKTNDSTKNKCSFCKKNGHTEASCFSKNRLSNNLSVTKDVDFLGKPT